MLVTMDPLFAVVFLLDTLATSLSIAIYKKAFSTLMGNWFRKLLRHISKIYSAETRDKQLNNICIKIFWTVAFFRLIQVEFF